jgi:hypothetical protein
MQIKNDPVPEKVSLLLLDGSRRRETAKAALGLIALEPQIERPEHHNNSNVRYQPFPEPVPEEQDVHADHDGYQCQHVKHGDCPFSHPSLLLRAALLVNLTGLSVGPSRSSGPPACRQSTPMPPDSASCAAGGGRATVVACLVAIAK